MAQMGGFALGLNKINLTSTGQPWQRVCLCEKDSGALADSERLMNPKQGVAAKSFPSGDNM